MGVVGEDSTESVRAALPGRLSLRALGGYGLVGGLALGLTSLVVYDRSGYSHRMLLLWLAAVAGLGLFFASRSRALPRIALADVVLPGILVAALSPLYVVALYRWPVQVSSDEISVTTTVRRYAAMDNVDPFGLTDYLGHPALLFLFLGRVGEAFGGIDLAHMRLVSGLLGLALLLVSYSLFRQLLPRNWALFATFVLGVSHSLFMISRYAMRENTAALVEVTALTLLLWGLRNNSLLFTFAGGFAAGLAFYVYFPGRVTIGIWLLFLLGLALLYRERFPVPKLLASAAAAAAGFVLMAGPVLIAQHKAPPWTSDLQRQSTFLYAEGREVQRWWVSADTEREGWEKNVQFGLGTFNSIIRDHSWIYDNPGHGFLEPLSGALLWLGVVIVALRSVRRRKDPWPLLMLGGFLSLWLVFALLINKAPNFTRLLITLPFVAYLVAEGTRWLVERWRPVRRAPAVLFSAIAIALLVLNLRIAWDFIDTGRASPEPIGAAGRYVQAHKDIPGMRFFISAGGGFYVWGDDEISLQRLRLFAASDDQVSQPVSVSELMAFQAPPPFALFMPRGVWESTAAQLSDRYPRARLRNITHDGARVVFEVPS